MKYKVAILDDEVNSSKVLQKLLEIHCPELTIQNVFNDSRTGLESVMQHPPDLLFLDIQMPHINGIEFMNKFHLPEFEVIFTTAYQNFAMDAIKASAIDYILKPIDVGNLKEAVKKFIYKKQKTSGSDMVNDLIARLEKTHAKRLIVHLQDKTLFIDLNDLVYLKAESNYTHFHMVNGETFLTSKTIKYFETQLNSNQFFRSHQSYLVNTSYFTAYSKGDNSLVLKDKTLIPVSKQRKDDMMSALDF